MRNLALAAFFPMLFVIAVACVAEQPEEIIPGDSVIFTSGNQAWLVFSPADGSIPIIVATFTYGGDNPDPRPEPSKVAAIWIIENQEDRGKLTADQVAVLDDPVWQAAAIATGLEYRIEDKDHADAQPFLDSITIPLPVLCTVDGDGNLVAVVPLPAAVEGMRDLIGGVK